MAKNNNTETDRGTLDLGWWVSGGLLVVIIVGVIVGVVIWPKDTTAAPNTTPTATAPATPTAEDAREQPAAETAAACNTKGADQALPTEAPKTVWKTHPHEWLVPTSTEYGPSNQKETFWSCFEQSPSGAVIAGPNLFAAVSAGVEEAALPGPGRDAAIESVAEGSSDYERAVFEGFRVLAADKSSATIDYWVRAAGTNVSVVMEMVWDEDASDWRLNLEGAGDHPRISVLEDTSNYIAWR
ncbi:hypothetical protein E7744_14935 (plasmid) [Citricoccus sp. SGAir0253]|uniref:hypothetical protein n=1 Tax=Citricoccus sp. SGAir0253 TaxID=2567881 RepID=UPI0010CD1EAE|nr:hypothetical protein [Citricoccus sp. SGAir0253]QCU79612.1 hypothetical protein E7744_14935 [Citricoccus sp. SGAir0253]